MLATSNFSRFIMVRTAPCSSVDLTPGDLGLLGLGGRFAGARLRLGGLPGEPQRPQLGGLLHQGPARGLVLRHGLGSLPRLEFLLLQARFGPGLVLGIARQRRLLVSIPGTATHRAWPSARAIENLPASARGGFR